MVMGQTDIRTILKKMPFTLRVGNIPGGMTEFISLQAAIDYADAQTGTWTIEVYPGTYDEGEITTAGTANITILGIGEQAVTITPVAVPATAVMVLNGEIILENLIVTSPGAAVPAIQVNGPGTRMTHCFILGAGGGNAIDIVNGACTLVDCDVGDDITISTNPSNLYAYDCRLGDNIVTAGALLHTMEIINCDLYGSNVNSAATGATILIMNGCTHVGTIANAGTGAFTIRGSEVDAISATATGTFVIYGGSVSSITRAAASVVWWLNESEIKVLVSDTATDTVITYALAAAAVPGTPVTLHLVAGTYQETNIALVNDVHLLGAGHEVTIISDNSANNILTAGNVTCTLKDLQVLQAGTGACIVTNNAGSNIYLDHLKLTAAAGQDVIVMTAGIVFADVGEFTQGDIELSTAACSLTLLHIDMDNGNINTAGAFNHTITLSHCDLHGQNITNAATGATTIDIRYCTDINAFSDASLLGTMLIEQSIIVTATKTGTSPWIVRIIEVGLLSNNNAVGNIVAYGGILFAINRAIGSIVWWKDANNLRVLPCTTITDTIIQWAVAAAGAGDTISIQPGTYEEAVTLAVGISLVGISKDLCIIDIDHATLVTMAEGASISTVTLNATGDATGDGTAIDLNDASCIIENTRINLTRTANDAFAIFENNGSAARTVQLRDVRVYSTDTDTYGVYLVDQADVTLWVEECWFEVDIAYWCTQDCTLYSAHTHWEGATWVFHFIAGTMVHKKDSFIGPIFSTGGTQIYQDGRVTYLPLQGIHYFAGQEIIRPRELRHPDPAAGEDISVKDPIEFLTIPRFGVGVYQMLTWNNEANGAVAFNTTNYVPLNTADPLNAVEADAQILVTRTGRLARLTIKITANTLNGAAVFTVRINGADSAIVMSIAATVTGTFQSPLIDDVHARDTITVDVDTTAAAAGNLTLKLVSLEVQ